MPPGRYRLGAVDIVVQPNYRAERADGAGSGILAGSAIDLLRGVENVIRFAGVSLSEAIAMASANPARLMGLSSRIGTVEQGLDANLIVFEWNADSRDSSIAANHHGGTGCLRCPQSWSGLTPAAYIVIPAKRSASRNPAQLVFLERGSGFLLPRE